MEKLLSVTVLQGGGVRRSVPFHARGRSTVGTIDATTSENQTLHRSILRGRFEEESVAGGTVES